jgi:peroxiredoxin
MRKFFFAMLLALPGLTIAQSKVNYEIHGRLNDVDVARVYILHTQGSFTQIIDSAEVVNHMYDIKGYVEVGQQAILMTYNFKTTKNIKPEGLVPFFLSAGKFNITHTKIFHNITVSGSKGYDDYLALKTAAKTYDEKNQALKIKVSQLTQQRDTVNANDAYAQQYTLEQDYKTKVYGNFIKQHPESPAAFYALKELAGHEHSIDGQKLEPYFELLPPNIKESEDGKELSKRINDAITFDTKGAVGSIAQGFTLLDTAGVAVKLSDYKGKYVLLDFWASWCSPCRADNPHLVSAFKQFHDKGFTILSVSLDTKSREKAWLNAIDHDHLTGWTHVADLGHDINSVVTLYGISGIPQNFLIGPDGKIIGRSLRGGDLEKKLSDLLNH